MPATVGRSDWPGPGPARGGARLTAARRPAPGRPRTCRPDSVAVTDRRAVSESLSSAKASESAVLESGGGPGSSRRNAARRRGRPAVGPSRPGPSESDTVGRSLASRWPQSAGPESERRAPVRRAPVRPGAGVHGCGTDKPCADRSAICTESEAARAQFICVAAAATASVRPSAGGAGALPADLKAASAGGDFQCERVPSFRRRRSETKPGPLNISFGTRRILFIWLWEWVDPRRDQATAGPVQPAGPGNNRRRRGARRRLSKARWALAGPPAARTGGTARIGPARPSPGRVVARRDRPGNQRLRPAAAEPVPPRPAGPGRRVRVVRAAASVEWPRRRARSLTRAVAHAPPPGLRHATPAGATHFPRGRVRPSRGRASASRTAGRARARERRRAPVGTL